MRLFRAFGFVVVIIALQMLVPRFFHTLESTAIAGLQSAQAIISVSSHAILDGMTPKLP